MFDIFIKFFSSLSATDLRTTLISVLISYLVFKISRFCLKIYSLPPGPIPLPIVGNLLCFRGTKNHQVYTLIELSKKYGPVFTLWIGRNPFVFITDLELAKDAFNRSELAGRPESFFGQLVSNEKHSDVLFADYGPKWMSLRRVAHQAVRKYSTSDKLVYLVSDVVDDTVKLIINREGVGQAFDPQVYVYNLFLNIMAATLFGKKYDIEDPEFKKLNYIFHEFFKEQTIRLTIIEYIPVMRYLDTTIIKKREQYMTQTKQLVQTKFLNHYKDFNESIVRDFSDALILAKNEALAEGKESAPYLNDDNLTMVLWDLFIAGVDTTHNTFLWMILILAKDQSIQTKLRQEIDKHIGDRMPVQEDRNNCHYIMAFISETLRYRLVSPLGFYHKAVVDTNIGKHNIPEGTGVFVHHHSILTDPKYWDKPEQFIPGRFLENGKYVNTRSNAYIPFGLGRRVCLGEKLALVELFLVLVRFLQSTSACKIYLDGEADLEPNPVHADHLTTKNFNIKLSMIN